MTTPSGGPFRLDVTGQTIIVDGGALLPENSTALE